MHEQSRLMTRRFLCEPASTSPLVRFDVSLMSVPHLPLLRSGEGQVLFGDALLADWRGRAQRGLVQLRCLIDVTYGYESRIVDSPDAVFPWGEPAPLASWVPTAEGNARLAAATKAIRAVAERLARAAGGKVELAAWGTTRAAASATPAGAATTTTTSMSRERR